MVGMEVHLERVLDISKQTKATKISAPPLGSWVLTAETLDLVEAADADRFVESVAGIYVSHATDTSAMPVEWIAANRM